MAGGYNRAQAFESTLSYSQVPRYQKLDAEYSQFSSAMYGSLSSTSTPMDYRSFDLIVAEAKHMYRQGNTANAIALLMSHKKLLKDNINSRGIIDVENLFLSAYEFNTAMRYLKYIKDQSDPSIINNVEYAFAKYYFSQDRWQKTISSLQDIINDLPAAAYQHALLMQGISLQNTRKQRKALSAYKNISSHSDDYVAARINMAIANTRQGWWTDAYDILKNLLKRNDVKTDKRLSDRIHTLIGYIFLQQEYYRNSRNAFRNVELRGLYTDQALLGIALDAGYQHDYVGALNAARILKDKNSSTLQVDEAHLLLPYFYEKLGQMTTASAGYTDAISYYKKRLARLKNTIGAVSSNSWLPSISGTSITINGEGIDLGGDLPPSFFRQYALLKIYKPVIEKLNIPSLHRQYNNLLVEFHRLIVTSTANALKDKVSYLTDYMNQSRYGLARLYDKNLSSAK